MTQEPKTKIQHPWFVTPFFDEMLQESDLSEENRKLVKQFAETGYLIIDPEIDNFDEVSSEIIDNLNDKYSGDHVLDGTGKRIQDAWDIFGDNNVSALACTPKVLEVLEMLFQRKPIPFQTLNFPVGTQQETHSDTLHFNSIPALFTAGVWIALEDIDDNNGPLHYYPGSNKLPLYEMHDFGITISEFEDPHQSYAIYEKEVKKMMAACPYERVEMNIKKGQALIWAANLFHGGSPIKDKTRTRHSQVTHYHFEKCMYYTPRLSDVPQGKIFWRAITDINTKQIVPSYFNGKETKLFPGNINYDMSRGLTSGTKLKVKKAVKRVMHMTALGRAVFNKIRKR
jgi:hypothetical protein